VDTKISENARSEYTMDKQTKTLKKRPRRTFTPEFKAETVRLCKVADRSITRVAADLNLTPTALREWVHRADIDRAATIRPAS